MKQKSFILFLTLAGMALLAGCGGGGGSPPGAAKNTLRESETCIGCHEGINWQTPGTGQPVVTDWIKSSHTKSDGASCADCHGSDYLNTALHPVSCSKCHGVGGLTVTDFSHNPDRDARCSKCHALVNPRPGKPDGYTPLTANGVPVGSTTGFTHFSTGLRSNYVASNYKNNCRKCHNPHDTGFGREQREQWAESGHGNTRGLAPIGADFKLRGSRLPFNQNISGNYCVRCHTSTGFINFVANNSFLDVRALPDIGANGQPDPNGFRSNFPDYKVVSNVPYASTDTLNTTPLSYRDKSREGTNCDVCHLDARTQDSSSYSGTLRDVAVGTGVPIWYPYSSTANIAFKTNIKVQFDDLGNSNLCLTCHSGRASGGLVRKSSDEGLDFSKKPTAPSVHDFNGGAVFQGNKSAFLYYTDPSKYTVSAHRTINSNFNAGQKGPCIGCHMPLIDATPPNIGKLHSHFFRPVTWTDDDINMDVKDPILSASVCSTCHAGASRVTPAYLNDLRKGYRVSVRILFALRPSSTNNWTGSNTNVTPARTYPGNGPAAVGSYPAGVYTMGATFNYNLLNNEPSAYVHNPIFVRQIIYDSIDWYVNGPTLFGTDPVNVYNNLNRVVNDAGISIKWSKPNPISGAILGSPPTTDYGIYNVGSDRIAALAYLCKNYVSGVPLTQCDRW